MQLNIVVDGEEYRWLIRRKATQFQIDYGSGFINVAIEHAQEKGAVLVVYTDRPHPKDWATTAVEPVIPSDVGKWIEEAISLGVVSESVACSLSVGCRSRRQCITRWSI